MFDVNWSELLILAIVALVCIGPKDLPRFMSMIGKYAGAAKRQAAEFRRHFDEAMKEAELADLQKDMSDMARDVNDRVMSAGKSIDDEIAAARSKIAGPLPTATTRAEALAAAGIALPEAADAVTAIAVLQTETANQAAPVADTDVGPADAMTAPTEVGSRPAA